MNTQIGSSVSKKKKKIEGPLPVQGSSAVLTRSFASHQVPGAGMFSVGSHDSLWLHRQLFPLRMRESCCAL